MNEIAGIPLAARQIAVAGRHWTLHAVENQDALLALSDRREPFPFGLLLWESAIALAAEIGDTAGSIAGRRMLELGCGVGLTALVAASNGSHVTAIDHDPLALELARANAAANAIGGIVFAEADWSAWSDGRPYDIVIGADVTYDRDSHDPVLAILERNLAPDGLALLADPGRDQQAQFAARASAAGWSVGRSTRAVPDLKRTGITIEITIFILRRSP